VPDFHPHVRRIDPDAEAARLAEERKQRTAASQPGHVLCDEMHQIAGDGEAGIISIRVLSSLPPAKLLPPALGATIAHIVWTQCYPDDQSP
jgi:hypothetical protein